VVRQRPPIRSIFDITSGRFRSRNSRGPVTRGLYINQLARPLPTAADAAGFVRGGAIVSLQTVLGEAGITNNYSDIVTCVVPHSRDHKPSVRPVKAERIEFRFHAMPARFLDEHAGALEDRIDLDFKYPRATPEKALLDWIYLGASARTKISGPPFDIDSGRLKKARLQRLAKAICFELQLKTFLEGKRKYDADPEVEANAPLDTGLEKSAR
jgi:hypothetical protein